MDSAQLAGKTVVLLGMGHTHAHVARQWGMAPPRDAQLVCLAPHAVATYSGMLPGVLAGAYARSEMEIDLVRCCARIGARWISDPVAQLDVAGRRLLFADRPALRFDVLSIGMGSVPSLERTHLDTDRLLLIKPMPTFLARLETQLTRVMEQDPTRPPRIAIVGGGAGGVELAFCLPAYVHRLAHRLGLLDSVETARPSPAAWRDCCRVSLIQGAHEIPAGFAAGTQRRVAYALEQSGVQLHRGERVSMVIGMTLQCDSGRMLDADVIIWAATAAPPPLIAQLNLPTDARGFLAVDQHLQCHVDAPIFAVGDTASFTPQPLAKCGVYAVRQGPVLWQNIVRTLEGQPLVPFRPQRDFLRLLNLGDGRAIGEWRGRSFAGAWVWRWKDRIDRRFMAMYQPEHWARMTADRAPSARATTVERVRPRCVGCGGKVPRDVLVGVLGELQGDERQEVVVGLRQPDDGAIVRPDPNRLLTITNDHFTSPLEDPYLSGRLAALNALSDAWVMGGEPYAALATVIVPSGDARAQRQVLSDLMAGSLRELKAAHTTLVGGHSVEGPRLGMGFTILAHQDPSRILRKTSLQPGDRLLLTKPLGVGVLLAQLMEAACRAEYWDSLLECLLASNGPAMHLALAHGVTAATDVTGFGLGGHLIEMLQGTSLRAILHADSIPRLPGADAAWADGWRSTMDPANRSAFGAHLKSAARTDEAAGRPWLFDPQTSGGVLLGVAAAQADELLTQLRSIPSARWTCCVGEIESAEASDAGMMEIR